MAKPRKSSRSDADAPAHGTLVDARRSLKQATSRGDKTLKTVLWAAAALVAVALLVILLAP